MNRIDSAALDRHITGNYGEDQYRDYEVCDGCDDEVEDPATRLIVCRKNKCPTDCKMERKDDYLAEQADRARQDR